jgi:hypothetical protein
MKNEPRRSNQDIGDCGIFKFRHSAGKIGRKSRTCPPHSLSVWKKSGTVVSRGRLEQTLKRQLSFTEVRRLKMADLDEILKIEKQDGRVNQEINEFC